METLQPYIIGWLIPTVLAAIAGYLAGKVKRFSARDKAIENGLRCILRSEITRAYQRHIIDGRSMTLDAASKTAGQTALGITEGTSSNSYGTGN